MKIFFDKNCPIEETKTVLDQVIYLNENDAFMLHQTEVPKSNLVKPDKQVLNLNEGETLFLSGENFLCQKLLHYF